MLRPAAPLALIAAALLLASCGSNAKCVERTAANPTPTPAPTSAADTDAEHEVAWEDEAVAPRAAGAPGFATGMEAASGEAVGNPPSSRCGHEKASKAFTSLAGWDQYLCRDAAEGTAGCYPRHAYTTKRGGGCPGLELCCQAQVDCASTWECRELGWCTLEGDHCVATSAEMCQSSSRCEAIGTCTFVAAAEGGVGDCCTSADPGGYCVANEVRFEASDAPAKRAKRCWAPPPFQGARTDEDAFSVTGDAVDAGTVRHFGFGDGLIASRGEGGTTVYVLHGLDSCGLWVEKQSASSGVFDVQRLQRSRWLKLQPGEDGSWVLRKLGAGVAIRQEGPGRFAVELLTRIRKYSGPQPD